MNETNNTPAADPYDLVRAEVMLRGYDARWRDDRYEVLAVEQEFRAPLINPATGAASRTWQLAGKLDALVRDAAGRVLIVEHKTSSEDISLGSDYWRVLRMDGQVSTYFAGARALGHTADACLYDVLGKPQQRPSAVPLRDENGAKIVLDAAGNRVRTKDGKKWRETGDAAEGYVLQTREETPDEYRARLIDAIAAEPGRYFARGEVVRLESEMREFAFDTWQIATQLREASNAGFYPREPKACRSFNRVCGYLSVCCGEARLDDPTRFRRVELHRELSPVTEGELPLLTTSRVSAASACQRMHKYMYLDGVRPVVEAATLRFGTLVHAGLRAWWETPADGDRLSAALAAIGTGDPQPSVGFAAAA